MKNRDVIFISLASSDRFGQPLKYRGVYDIMTKREMNAHSVTFMSSLDLNHFVGAERSFSSAKFPMSSLESNTTKCTLLKDNRKFVMETCRDQTIADKAATIMRNDIDFANAVSFYNDQLLKCQNIQELEELISKDNWPDVYQSLKKFIQAHRDYDIYIDELLVLLSTASKLASSFYNCFNKRINAYQ